MDNIRTFTVIVTELCNLNCKYCYVKDNPKQITDETIDALISYTDKMLAQPGDIRIQYDLFGGEPLTAWDQLVKLLNKIEEQYKRFPKRTSACIFSNGILFTEEKLTLIRDNFPRTRYNFSLDGCKEAHNSSRVHHDGSGSYDEVIEGLKAYAKVYKKQLSDLPVKAMISPHNVQYLIKDAESFLELGIKRAAFAVVRDDIWDEESLALYETNLRKLADFYVKNIDKGIWYDIFALTMIEFQRTRRTYCSAGKEMLGITPTGDIYPCQRFYNNRSPFKLGNVFEGIDETSKGYKLFTNYKATNIVGCNNCDTFTHHNCVGQCVASMYESQKNMFLTIPSVCELWKITHKVSLGVYEKLKDHEGYKKTLDIGLYGG